LQGDGDRLSSGHAPFKRSISLPDGKDLMREFKAGDALYPEAQTHVGRNLGDTPRM